MPVASASALKEVLARLHRAWSHWQVRAALATLALALAFMVLHSLAAETSWADIRREVANESWRTLALAGLATAGSLTAAGCYDLVGLRALGARSVPAPVVLTAGAGGTSISNVLGFGPVTGGALRLRVYSGLGVPVPVGAEVIGMSSLFVWGGLAALLAGVLLLYPAGLAAIMPLPVPVGLAIGLGVAGALAALLVWLARRPGGWALLGHEVALPPARFALAGIAVGAVDLGCAAMALFLLLPDGVTLSFAGFLPVYVLAVVLGIVSLAPGGLGVFEATLIAGLGAGGQADVLAALALYRAIYYFAPFGLTAALLGAAVSVSRRRGAVRAARIARQVVAPAVPPAAAALSMLVGVVLLVSGGLPAEGARMGVLREVLPLGVVEVSHLAASVVGVLLLVMARGLFLRRRRAWLATLGLLGTGLAASLVKGLDWEEAAASAAALGLLWAFRDAFYRGDASSLLRLSPRWLLGGMALLAAAIWIGMLAYGRTPYDTDLWWRFAWSGDAPRFLRASLAAVVVLGGIAVNSLLSGTSPRLPPEPIPDAVRALAAASPNTEAQIALTGGKRFLVSPGGDAFLSYADTGATLVSKGDPVGDPAAGADLLWRLREMADRMGRRVAFYAVWSEYLPVYLDMGLAILKIGEVARVDLSAFDLAGGHRKGLRAARSRAAREGVVFEIVPREAVAPLFPELRRVSDDWLALKQGTEKAFALGAFEETYLSNFDMALLRQGPGGPVLAFANLMRGGDGAELTIDLMRHAPDAPGYAMDVLFVEMFLWGRAQGFRWFSLGAVPLAGLEDHRLSTVWNRVGRFAYEHGERVYHFEGLRGFKEKFDPVWSPNYLAAPRGLPAARVLLEVNALISGGLRGLARQDAA